MLLIVLMSLFFQQKIIENAVILKCAESLCWETPLSEGAWVSSVLEKTSFDGQIYWQIHWFSATSLSDDPGKTVVSFDNSMNKYYERVRCKM